MLKPTFLPASSLGVTPEYHAALVQVLGELERDELPHHPYEFSNPRANGVHFNMSTWRNDYEEGRLLGLLPGHCGTVCCIGGRVDMILGIDTAANVNDRALARLFFVEPRLPDYSWYPRVSAITPEQAARALRNYLETGEPRWEEVLA